MKRVLFIAGLLLCILLGAVGCTDKKVFRMPCEKVYSSYIAPTIGSFERKGHLQLRKTSIHLEPAVVSHNGWKDVIAPNLEAKARRTDIKNFHSTYWNIVGKQGGVGFIEVDASRIRKGIETHLTKKYISAIENERLFDFLVAGLGYRNWGSQCRESTSARNISMLVSLSMVIPKSHHKVFVYYLPRIDGLILLPSDSNKYFRILFPSERNRDSYVSVSLTGNEDYINAALNMYQNIHSISSIKRHIDIR